MIRDATIDDIASILDIGRAKYGYMNSVEGTAWLRRTIGDKNCRVLVGSHSFAIASKFRAFYWKKPRGYILHVASTPKGLSREALRIVAELFRWTSLDCFETVLGSEIGTDYASFAKALGATPSTPSYVIRFDQEPQYA